MTATSDHLADACRAAQARQGKSDAVIMLRVPGKPWGRRTHCRLPGGVKGRIVGDDIRPGGSCVGVIAEFKADEVLAALQAPRVAQEQEQ